MMHSQNTIPRYNFIRILKGRGSLIKKAQEGESYNVSLKFANELYVRGVISEPEHSLKKGESLTVELQAAGCKISGDSKQTKDIGSEYLNYHWNIAFEKSGNYELKFIGTSNNRLYSERDFQVFELEHKIKVSKHFGLTPNQISMAASISGLAAFILAALQILQILGYIPK